MTVLDLELVIVLVNYPPELGSQLIGFNVQFGALNICRQGP